MILGIRIFSYWYAREIFRAIDEDTVAESSSVYSPLMPYLMMLGLVLVFTGIVLNSSEEKSSKTWRGVWKRFSTADLSDEKQEKLLSEIEAKNTPES